MRVLFSRPIWLKLGVLSLSVASLAGCKTMPAPPGLGWLGWWGDSKPPSSSLSGMVPSKPSAANLPPPSASTSTYAQNGQYGPYGAQSQLGTQSQLGGQNQLTGQSQLGTQSQLGGQSTSLASYPSGTGVTQPAASHAPSGYNVGPYAMSNANHSHNHSHTSLPAANTGTSSYAAGTVGAAGGPATQTPGYGGYQSPYAAGAATTGGATTGAARTADNRNLYSAGESAPKLNPYATPSTPTTPGGNWNDDPRAHSGGSLGSAGGATTEVNAQLPRSYSPTPAGYNSGGSWAPPEAGAQNTSADRLDASPSPSTTSGLAPRRDGAFRPGSTARNAGALPAQLGSAPMTQSQSLGSSSPYGSPYPTTSSSSSPYPSTGYPSLGGADRTASGTSDPSQFR